MAVSSLSPFNILVSLVLRQTVMHDANNSLHTDHKK